MPAVIAIRSSVVVANIEYLSPAPARTHVVGSRARSTRVGRSDPPLPRAEVRGDATVSTRCAPETTTSTAVSSARKTSLLAIAPTAIELLGGRRRGRH